MSSILVAAVENHSDHHRMMSVAIVGFVAHVYLDDFIHCS